MSSQHSMDDRIADFWEFERDHGWGSVRDEAEKLIRDLEEQLEAAHEEILFLCSDEDDIRKGLREQLEATRREVEAQKAEKAAAGEWSRALENKLDEFIEEHRLGAEGARTMNMPREEQRNLWILDVLEALRTSLQRVPPSSP